MSKSEWGNATWYLLHTLSHKLKKEHESHVPILYDQFVKICNNLPCPYCSEHASMYIKSNPAPSTIDKLNMFFWGLHNWVNYKLHKPQFSSKEYMHKYHLARTHNIIQNFIIILSKNTRNDKAMLNSFNRNIIIADFIKYINNNIYRFNT